MAGQRNTPDVDIKFDDEAYIRGVVSHIRRMKATSENDVEATAIYIVSKAVGYSPVLTGFMKNNIVWEKGRDAKGFFVAILCRASYWKHVEFGHRKVDSSEMVPAQPFMRPAFVEGLIFLRTRILRRRAS